ncbi:reverse transcriptase [Gossypium australe]|uniref:Reverse transcriptase n=1 Tax=Gossypium australe TaxID=47621 RepID=A0A5B6VNC4_9ROSI|nr:reverse transcriptase [Gossypium australe]
MAEKQGIRKKWKKLLEHISRIYSGQEKKVILNMGATKAPGEDGFPAIFFQKFWHILNGDIEVSQINTTHIVFIPKKTSPTNLSHFHPISLCNVIYKIMAKAIANRFRGVLEKCIDKAQSAFVPGRLISDNVLVAYKILHTLKRKKLGKERLMAVKLDMSKAYDRVEWAFLEEMMRKMGFEPRWIRLIMKAYLLFLTQWFLMDKLEVSFIQREDYDKVIL